MPVSVIPSPVAAILVAISACAAPLTPPAAWSAPCAPTLDPSHVLLAAPNHSDQLFFVLAVVPALFKSRPLRNVASPERSASVGLGILSSTTNRAKFGVKP
jgi:hypothetical protein